MFPLIAGYFVQFSHLMTSYFQSESGRRYSGSLFEVGQSFGRCQDVIPTGLILPSFL